MSFKACASILIFFLSMDGLSIALSGVLNFPHCYCVTINFLFYGY